jgi:tripartite-type tricarboxylate transporter receptor subunit TctC
MRLGLRCFIGAIALFACSVGHAENNYPTRSVRIVVPVGPSGPSDTIARLIAEKLSQKLGQPFIVENQAGAANNIGIANVARAAPDGYTILLVSSNCTINPALFAKFRSDQRLEPVMIAATSPAVLITNLSIPATNLGASHLPQGQSANSYASPGVGTTICLANVQALAGVDLVYVRSTAQAPSFSRWANNHADRIRCNHDGGGLVKANCGARSDGSQAFTGATRSATVAAGFPDLEPMSRRILVQPVRQSRSLTY